MCPLPSKNETKRSRGASVTTSPFDQVTTFVTDLVNKTFSTPPTLSSHPTVKAISEQLHLDLSNEQGQILRRVLSNYYLPTSPASSASLSLTEAVIRQGSFVEKMHNHLWLRSPAFFSCPPEGETIGTLPRAQHRYRNFFSLFSKFPGETMVPTLDVDLFWHTHQLSPILYFRYCLTHAKRFIDHDDKLSTGVLDTGFEDTIRRYEESFEGEAYGGCFCWFCEMEINDGLYDEDVRGWWRNGKKERQKKEWGVRVKVSFYQESEKRRVEGGERVGWSSLRKVLTEKAI